MIKRPGWLEDQIFIVFTKYPLFFKLIFITLERYPYSRYEGKASLGEKMLLNGLYPFDLVPLVRTQLVFSASLLKLQLPMTQW